MSFPLIDPTLFPPNVAKLPRTAKRLVQLLSKGSSTPASQAQKEWSLDFLLSPKAFEASNEAPDVLSSIAFQRTVLQGPDLYHPSTKALPTADMTSLSTSLAFRSIGYKSEAIDGMKDLNIDFDHARGIISNDYHGRITRPSADGTAIPGLYCSGWVKRGPAGVIANTMEEAFGTAEAIAKDWAERKSFMAGGDGWDALKEEARQRDLRPVSWNDWKKIDHAEKARGTSNGKPREKFPTIQEMLGVLD